MSEVQRWKSQRRWNTKELTGLQVELIINLSVNCT